MKPAEQYKCPNCKYNIQITRAEFINGVAITSCGGCGMDGFAIEEAMLI